MRFTAVRWLLVSVFLLPMMSCRSLSGQEDDSQVKDLIDILLPPEVTAYRDDSEAELDKKFADGQAPANLPSGYGMGIHIISKSTQAEVPKLLALGIKILWKGKWFNAETGMMRDDSFGPDFGSPRAVISIEAINDVLKRHAFDGKDARASLDTKPSLIADYASTEYSGILKETVKLTKGWIEEYRIVEEGEKPILLGRASYNGKFWGYIVLQLDPKVSDGSIPIPANPTREDLKKMNVDQWAALFRRGKATQELIPSREHPGVTVPGIGFPLIFQTLGSLNDFANHIWNGKNFTTKDGRTGIKNQFTKEIAGFELFDAQVILDKSRYDGKDIILIDYTPAGVPGIEAIRDEVRMVAEEIKGNKRRRLFLGPTYLRSQDLPVISWAKRFETVPFLWFSLEVTEDVP